MIVTVQSLSFAMAAAAGAVVWALSPFLSGAMEPWDADGSYYVRALAVAGFVVGLTLPRRRPAAEERDVRARRAAQRLLAVYAGFILGQLLYGVMFLTVGPLIAIGVLFLAAYSVVAVVAAVVGFLVRGGAHV